MRDGFLGAFALTLLALASYFGVLPWALSLTALAVTLVLLFGRLPWRYMTYRAAKSDGLDAVHERVNATRKRPRRRAAARAAEEAGSSHGEDLG